ncbi:MULTISPECIES: hypothetical protein [unclassified Nostoc]|nr:hypothetical protein [Nostoc sp. JL31]
MSQRTTTITGKQATRIVLSRTSEEACLINTLSRPLHVSEKEDLAVCLH